MTTKTGKTTTATGPTDTLAQTMSENLREADLKTLREFSRHLEQDRQSHMSDQEGRFAEILKPAVDGQWSTENSKGELISKVLDTPEKAGDEREQYERWLRLRLHQSVSSGVGEGYDPNSQHKTILQDVLTAVEQPRLMSWNNFEE